MHAEELSRHALAARSEGREVVAVLGLGVVGTAVAATLARARRAGRRGFFVIGVERDSEAGRRKLEAIERGEAPVQVGTAELARILEEAALEPRSLACTVDLGALEAADVIVCCTGLELRREPGQTEQLECPVEEHGESLRAVGQNMRPGTLVLIESTVPLGACEHVLYPALVAGQRERGVDVEAWRPRMAYCYERVMPGPRYLDSVAHIRRSYAGIDAESADRAQEFLEKFVDVERYPLWRHASMRAAELAKLMENAYRAANIAFIEEWAELAEDAGIDLFDVIESIRVRRGTHDNMMRPGLGVGGQCVTKDALLARYGARELLGIDARLPFSSLAILTNERMPLRAVDWFREHSGGALAGRRALLLGVTYLPGVADTRSSPTEIVARALLAEGVEVTAFDPLVPAWEELPDVPVLTAPADIEGPFELAVVCLPDPEYTGWLPALLSRTLTAGALVVDPWNTLGSELGAELGARGVTVKVYGRGDLRGGEAR